MKGKLKYPFVYHHIISAYYMYVEPSIIAVKGLTTAELSNIHLLGLLFFKKKIQMGNYEKDSVYNILFIRAFILGYYTYVYKEAQNKLPISLMILVYIMDNMDKKSL